MGRSAAKSCILDGSKFASTPTHWVSARRTTMLCGEDRAAHSAEAPSAMASPTLATREWDFQTQATLRCLAA